MVAKRDPSSDCAILYSPGFFGDIWCMQESDYAFIFTPEGYTFIANANVNSLQQFPCLVTSPNVYSYAYASKNLTAIS